MAEKRSRNWKNDGQKDILSPHFCIFCMKSHNLLIPTIPSNSNDSMIFFFPTSVFQKSFIFFLLKTMRLLVQYTHFMQNVWQPLRIPVLGKVNVICQTCFYSWELFCESMHFSWLAPRLGDTRVPSPSSFVCVKCPLLTWRSLLVLFLHRFPTPQGSSAFKGYPEIREEWYLRVTPVGEARLCAILPGAMRWLFPTLCISVWGQRRSYPYPCIL